MNKIETIKKIEQLLNNMVFDGLNIHDLDDEAIVDINDNLSSENLIYYSITRVSDDSDEWLQCDYYSKKLGKTIIWDYGFGYESDGDTVELMAESIYQLDQDIINFEARISLKEA